MTEHSGLSVAGYNKQSDEKVALVNENKVLEERVMRQLDAMVDMTGHVDQRMVALGRTNIQQAFMWINRAVFQPGRVTLPEDGVGSAPAA